MSKKLKKAAHKVAPKKTMPKKAETSKKVIGAKASKTSLASKTAPKKEALKKEGSTSGTEKLKKALAVGAVAAVATAALSGKKKAPVKKLYSEEDSEIRMEDDLGESDEDVVEEEEVEVEEEGAEGPPPWWKDNPAGIEGNEEESGSHANFDDSDEWTEDDEDWATNKKASIDEIESSDEDEDGRW